MNNKKYAFMAIFLAIYFREVFFLMKIAKINRSRKLIGLQNQVPLIITTADYSIPQHFSKYLNSSLSKYEEFKTMRITVDVQFQNTICTCTTYLTV